MRISDWSSDVCSSDLDRVDGFVELHAAASFARPYHLAGQPGLFRQCDLQPLAGVDRDRRRQHHAVIGDVADAPQARVALAFDAGEPIDELGKASWRERVCQYVSIQVVAVPLKKK